MKTVSPYLSAEDLGLKEEHRRALIGLADDLAHHRIPDDDWGMSDWNTCICGHLQKRTGVGSTSEFGTKILNLFVGSFRIVPSSTASQESAGQATYNYLTIGRPRWGEVMDDTVVDFAELV